MENTKQYYSAPSFRIVTAGPRRVMCQSPYGIEDMNYVDLKDMDE